MNKTKIESFDYTWNPITGCSNSCSYCYARKIASRFPNVFTNGFLPTYWPNRIMEPTKVKIPSRIFVGSMGDIVYQPDMVINAILKIVEATPQHSYFFLTKFPMLAYFRPPFHGIIPKNAWLGFSFHDGLPSDICRLRDFPNVWCSWEPFRVSKPAGDAISKIKTARPGWIVAGYETPHCNLKSKAFEQQVMDSFGTVPMFFKDTMLLASKVRTVVW